MEQKNKIYLIIIIVLIVIIAGGIIFGWQKGWLSSSADVKQKLNYPPTSATPEGLGNIRGVILFEKVTYTGSNCQIFLSAGGGGGLNSTSTDNGLFSFDNLSPGNNYILTAICQDPTLWQLMGMGGPVTVESNKTTNVEINLIPTEK